MENRIIISESEQEMITWIKQRIRWNKTFIFVYYENKDKNLKNILSYLLLCDVILLDKNKIFLKENKNLIEKIIII